MEKIKKICLENGKILNLDCQVSDLRNDLGLGFEKWKWQRRVNFGSRVGNRDFGNMKNFRSVKVKNYER